MASPDINPGLGSNGQPETQISAPRFRAQPSQVPDLPGRIIQDMHDVIRTAFDSRQVQRLQRDMDHDPRIGPAEVSHIEHLLVDFNRITHSPIPDYTS